MKQSFLTTFVSGIAALSLTNAAMASGLCAEDAMLVFDGSASMSEATYHASPGRRIDDARRAVQKVMPEVTPYRDVGLMVYGPGGTDACTGIKLAFGPSKDTAGEIISAIEGVVPNGMTPLADAIELAADVMEYQTRPSVIVVVTDGYESCGGTPCELATRLSEQSNGLRIHVVGFNIANESLGWAGAAGQTRGARCLADNTGGMYVAAQTAEELVNALNATLGCMLLTHRSRASHTAG